ncbi:uncharacterized protein LOC144454287 isoform X2 [Phascolarctos cinereus]
MGKMSLREGKRLCLDHATSELDIPLRIVSRTTLITLGCIIILFFLFLLAFFCHQHPCIASPADGIFLNVSGSPQTCSTGGGDHEYRHGQEEIDPSNSGAEDQEGVIYSQLNIETQGKGKTTAYETRKQTIYSTLAWH